MLVSGILLTHQTPEKSIVGDERQEFDSGGDDDDDGGTFK